MIFFRNVAQGIFQCQFGLGRAEAEAAVRGSADTFLERFLRRKSIREFQFDCHSLCDISIFHVVTTPSFTRYPDKRGFPPSRLRPYSIDLSSKKRRIWAHRRNHFKNFSDCFLTEKRFTVRKTVQKASPFPSYEQEQPPEAAALV